MELYFILYDSMGSKYIVLFMRTYRRTNVKKQLIRFLFMELVPFRNTYTLQLRRLPRILPPRVCLPYTYVNLMRNLTKQKLNFSSFLRWKFLKFCTYQDITFVSLNTDFHKITSKDFFSISILNLFVHCSKMYRCIFFKIRQKNNQNTTHWFASF